MGKTYDDIDVMFEDLKNEIDVEFLGKILEVVCPECNKEIKIVINKQNYYRCSECNEEISLEFDVK